MGVGRPEAKYQRLSKHSKNGIFLYNRFAMNRDKFHALTKAHAMNNLDTRSPAYKFYKFEEHKPPASALDYRITMTCIYMRQAWY